SLVSRRFVVDHEWPLFVEPTDRKYRHGDSPQQPHQPREHGYGVLDHQQQPCAIVYCGYGFCHDDRLYYTGVWQV
ncbi:hypothetical protein F442_02882, partial [Phytophthora nicotianae P10297]